MTKLSFYNPTCVPTVSNRIWNNLFENFFEVDSRADNNDYWMPRTNTKENEKEFTVELLMPGIKKENIKIQVENDVLTITAENKQENEGKYHFREFGHSYKRSFTLPENINQEGIAANYSEGVLTVTLPKLEKVPVVSRQIEIQ